MKRQIELADTITDANQAIALLHMLQVFCNIEQRDMTAGMTDGTLSDAAEGLAILLGDLVDRVELIKGNLMKLSGSTESGGA